MYLLNTETSGRPGPRPSPQGARPSVQAKDLLAAARAAERASEAVTPEQQMRAVSEVLAHQEAIQIGLMNAQIGRISTSYRDARLPLRVDGDDFGTVEARIPKDLFFHLGQQKNFGFDGFYDKGGMKDFLKAFPQCQVKTVSGKCTVGAARGDARPTRRVVFGRGTLNLAS